MAGGEGRRIGNRNKAMLRVCGKPILERILSAAEPLGKVYVVTTERHIEVINWCKNRGMNPVITQGLGYARDLVNAVRQLGTPILILPGDVPFISTETLRDFIKASSHVNLPIVTLLVVRGGETEPLGISLIRVEPMGESLPWANLLVRWRREFMNINTKHDLDEANKECGDQNYDKTSG